MHHSEMGPIVNYVVDVVNKMGYSCVISQKYVVVSGPRISSHTINVDRKMLMSLSLFKDRVRGTNLTAALLDC